MQNQSPVTEVPKKFRHLFDEAALASFSQQAPLARETLLKASKEALAEGRLAYQEFFEAELGFNDNNLPEALQHYDRALASEPHNPLFLSNKAIVLSLAGKPEEAIPLYRRALAANPAERHASVGLAMALTDVGRSEDARQIIGHLLNQNDLLAPYRMGLSQALIDLDEDQKALEILSRLLIEYPGSLLCQNLRFTIDTKLTAKRSREFKRRPYLRALLTCDEMKVIQGKPLCEGIFDFINLLSFPSIAPRFFVFVSFVGRRLHSRLTVSIRDSKGANLFQATVPSYLTDFRGSSYASLDLRALTLKAPGTYVIELKVDGKRIGTSPLGVRQIEPRPEYTREQVSALLKDPQTLKSARGSFNCGRCNSPYVLQMNLDQSAPIPADALPFPQNDLFVCPKCGNEINTRELRLKARQVLGSRGPRDTQAQPPKADG